MRHNARGVAILFGNNFEYKILHVDKDNEGNMLLVDLEINDNKFKLINMYGPNTDNEDFYNSLSNIIATNEEDYLIWCGDFNLILNPLLDCNNYRNINNPKNRNIVINLIQEQNLIDAFRYFYPESRRYTWHKTRPMKQARLDYFIVSSAFTDLVTEINIKPSYRSDHSVLELSFLISKFKRGKGLWKLNTSFLKEQKFLDLVNGIIKEEFQYYAIPVYSPLYLANLTEDIELIIDYDLFLEVLLLRIRGEAIKYGSIKKRQNKHLQEKLNSEIEKLEKNVTPDNIKVLESKKKELVNIRQHEMQGHLIRSRTQWVIEGERPTKYFCALEHKNYMDKTIKCLRRRNHTVTRNQEEILQEMQTFYAELFKSKDNLLQNVDLKELLEGTPIERLNSMEAINMEGHLTVKELGQALKSTKSNKTPGLDGFRSEFFKVFWKNLKMCGN